MKFKVGDMAYYFTWDEYTYTKAKVVFVSECGKLCTLSNAAVLETNRLKTLAEMVEACEVSRKRIHAQFRRHNAFYRQILLENS